MTPEVFVARIQRTIIDEHHIAYTQLFESTLPGDATDQYWKRALTLYHSLDGKGRAIVLDIARQAAVDALSHLFGILDGTIVLDGADQGFELTATSSQQRINDCLQDLFLAANER